MSFKTEKLDRRLIINCFLSIMNSVPTRAFDFPDGVNW